MKKHEVFLLFFVFFMGSHFVNAQSTTTLLCSQDSASFNRDLHRHCFPRSEYPDSDAAWKKFSEIIFNNVLECKSDNCLDPELFECEARLQQMITTPLSIVTETHICFYGEIDLLWQCTDCTVKEAEPEERGSSDLIVDDEGHDSSSSENISPVELSPNKIVSLYPNPTKGDLNVQISIQEQGEHQVELKVYDVLGNLHVVKEYEEVPQSDFYGHLNLSRLSTGNYFIHVLVDNMPVGTRKIIIQ